MDQVLAQNDAFKLTKRSKDGKKWYEIKCDVWNLAPHSLNDGFDILEEVRDFFDPLRNKSGANGIRWKYKNRKDAEQVYAIAVLKFA